ncbi:MAG TPA: 1-(5-phosphoribosyl)-5-[(5-phosphoribosylamino)methylideneamino] imidazole-4-carboxamide isomerase [Candidatus Limnocylindrales bacterium]|nr:1-(5-phosphoribosyl)-5-[(5-phosphoribosylamino)methylideneamino] imidazole-4-carboxamide isomerase [Candidatus Limnocylindrales bacterium]
MEVIPALDLRGGRVVRLHQGAFDRETGYGTDPLAVAARWVAAGATRLHLVDLDGARLGVPVQAALVAAIVAAISVPCQVAGGLRDEAAVGAALAAGAERAVLGSALLADPSLAERLVVRYGPDRIVAALDVRDGQALGDGWTAGARRRPVPEVLAELTATGLRRAVVTAIERDGDLSGPDLGLMAAVRRAAPGLEVIASGGVRGLDDLRALADLGCSGAIVGKALYEGRLDLGQAAGLSR